MKKRLSINLKAKPELIQRLYVLKAHVGAPTWEKFFEIAVELLEQSLLKKTGRIFIFEETECDVCQGKGFYKSENIITECPQCGGTGKMLKQI